MLITCYEQECPFYMYMNKYTQTRLFEIKEKMFTDDLKAKYSSFDNVFKHLFTKSTLIAGPKLTGE